MRTPLLDTGAYAFGSRRAGTLDKGVLRRRVRKSRQREVAGAAEAILIQIECGAIVLKWGRVVRCPCGREGFGSVSA
jgi:hypothetical protein